jgi:hypothetical protein
VSAEVARLVSADVGRLVSTGVLRLVSAGVSDGQAREPTCRTRPERTSSSAAALKRCSCPPVGTRR